MIDRFCHFGISPTLLFPEMFEDDYGHLCGFAKAVALEKYEVLETFVSENDCIRKEELKILMDSGKRISYNLPVAIQKPGKYNPCSFDLNEQKNAIELTKRHLDYAAEVKSGYLLMTSGPDCCPERREDVKKNLMNFFHSVAPYAARYGIRICIEPTERSRFKKQLLGPTVECVDFIQRLHADKGCENVGLMIDTAHSPLLEEDAVESLNVLAKEGVSYVHLGNAVLDPSNTFYGHTHPPVGVQGGLVDCKELSAFIKALFMIGYLDERKGWNERPFVSYEMKPYPGLPGALSASVAYEKAEYAFQLAYDEFSKMR